MKKHLNIKITGQVQGVFFRDTACKVANKLGIVGWVRNEPDGTVYIEVEGESDKVDEFVKWCEQGPKMAKIAKIDCFKGEMAGFKGFEYIY
tara:strand:- start:385 stop:657 length:273 start_codon:yes stop_codon:yes gene_type:complete